MRRALVSTISFLSLGLLYAGAPPQESPSGELLPHVGAAPEFWSAPSPEQAERDADPALQSLLAQLHARHTGLSRQEIHELARAVIEESNRHQLDPELVFAVMQVESSCYNFAVSRVGALGLMQIMPFTGEDLAKRLGVEWHGPDTLFDPIVNVRLGTAYLRQLSDRYGSLPAALAASNWGPAQIDRRLRRGAALPSEYVQQVMRAYDTPQSRRAQRS